MLRSMKSLGRIFILQSPFACAEIRVEYYGPQGEAKFYDGRPNYCLDGPLLHNSLYLVTAKKAL